MALELPNSIFFHMGRTAGHWVRFVVDQAGIPVREIGGFHDWPSCLSLDEKQNAKLKFCFIRHPLEWLRSYWMHEMQFGWSINEYSENLVSDSFAEFLRNAIKHHPLGPVSIAFAPFLEQCDEVGRQEDLSDALCRILTKAGERFDPEVLSSTGPVSVEIDPEIRRHALAPESVLKEMLELESGLCAKWGYQGVPRHLIGAESICTSPYVTVGSAATQLPDISPELLPDLENSFALGDRRVSGIRETRRTTLLIRRFLDELDLSGKAVIDTNCSDGVFAFHAEARDADRVVGIRQGGNRIADDCLKPALQSGVEFVSAGFYALGSLDIGRFDIAFSFRQLEKLRYPMLAIRCLSKLLKPGGTLILECGVVDFDTQAPVMLVPVGSESPNVSTECTFFNREGLQNALSAFGFHDFTVGYEFTHGIDHSRDFEKWHLRPKRAIHSSESVVGRILLSCKWEPDLASKDPRYLADGLSAGRLRDFWDSQLPAMPTAARDSAVEPDFDIRSELRRRESELAFALAQVQDHQAAIREREISLAQTIAQREDFERDLIERTCELEQIRQDVVDRTTELEQVRQELRDRTVDLVQIRDDLSSRTDDLNETRRILEERTGLLELAADDIKARTAELVETRENLRERTVRLESTTKELEELRIATTQQQSEVQQTNTSPQS
jgi:SAM-dependent methyltransferase